MEHFDPDTRSNTGNLQCKCGHVFNSSPFYAPEYKFEQCGDRIHLVYDNPKCPKCGSPETYIRVFCHSCHNWVVCNRFTYGRCPHCYKVLFEIVQLTKGRILDYVKPLCEAHKAIVKKREARRFRGKVP